MRMTWAKNKCQSKTSVGLQHWKFLLQGHHFFSIFNNSWNEAAIWKAWRLYSHYNHMWVNQSPWPFSQCSKITPTDKLEKIKRENYTSSNKTAPCWNWSYWTHVAKITVTGLKTLLTPKLQVHIDLQKKDTWTSIYSKLGSELTLCKLDFICRLHLKP